jgi:hypothetical protein
MLWEDVTEKTWKEVEGIVQLASVRDLGPVLDMEGGAVKEEGSRRGGREEKRESIR